MSVSLTPTQTLILWYLISHGGEAWLEDVNKVSKKPSDRSAMERAKLIAVEQRRNEKTRRKKKWIEVTDAGWAWANDHLDAKLPAKAQAASPILQAWLTHLNRYMKQRGIALAEIISGQPSSPEEQPETASDLRERIRKAYLQSSSGVWNTRVRLADLRRALNGVKRADLDKKLLEMQRSHELVLFPLDNRLEITAADDGAALMVGGAPAHILYMEGP